MKKVLIITYYWPPSGGVVVQRWLKFTKYLRSFGWEPIIYTVSNPHYTFIDEALINQIPKGVEVLRTKIWEPFRLYSKITKRKNSESISTSFVSEKSRDSKIEKIANFIRSNFFIPDARRFWIKPSIKYLTSYIRKNHIDVLVSTGPPHSLHLIGKGVAKKTNCPWVADFRDPWTGIDYYDELILTRFADKLQHKLEKSVLRNANQVIAVSENNKSEFEQKGANNVTVITNGFDQSDFDGIDVEIEEKFVLSHIGTFMSNRNPIYLWQALAELISENSEFRSAFRLRLIGKVDYTILTSIENNGLTSYLDRIEFVPHSEALIQMKKSPVLLLIANKSGNTKGMLTGKFYEYLGSGRPILAIGPTNGDISAILTETGQGVIVDHEEQIKMKKEILNFFLQYKNNKLSTKNRDIMKYSRYQLTGELSATLNELST